MRWRPSWRAGPPRPGSSCCRARPCSATYDGLSPVWQGDTLHQVRAAQHIYATGTIEQPLLFADNDRPGIMLSGGARRLLARYGLAPGRRAVVATVGERGLQAALALRRAGVTVAAVADARADAGPTGAELRAAGVPVLTATAVRRAHGRGAVSAVTLAPLGVGAEQTIEADLLVVSGGDAPAVALPSQAGVATVYDPQRGVVGLGDLPAGIGAAGSLCGDADALHGGRLAGLGAAHALGLGDAGSRELERGAGRRRRSERSDPGGGRRGGAAGWPRATAGTGGWRSDRGLLVRGRHHQGADPGGGGGL